jgi:hypothetical protein
MSWGVGAAINTTRSVVASNFVTFYTVALLLNAPSMLADLAAIGNTAGLFIAVGCHVLVSLCLTVGTLQAMNGERPSVTGLVRQTSRQDGTKLIILGLLQTLVIGLGLVLIAPGLWVLTLWAVAMPAMLVEGLPLGAALKRSAKLTQGHRWGVLGVHVLLFVLLVVGGGLLWLGLYGVLGTAVGSTGFQVLGWLGGSVLSMVFCSLPAVLYVLLRGEKEGTPIADIAAGAQAA